MIYITVRKIVFKYSLKIFNIRRCHWNIAKQPGRNEASLEISENNWGLHKMVSLTQIVIIFISIGVFAISTGSGRCLVISSCVAEILFQCGVHIQY